MPSRLKFTVALLASAVVLPLVACSAAAGPEGEVNQGAVDAANKIADDYRKPIAWEPPGPAFDVTPAKGKRYLYIANGLNLPYVKAQADTIKREMPKYGVDVTILDGKGNADDTSKAITQGIGMDVDLIAVATVPPTQIQPAIKQAHKAGIEFVMSGTHGDPEWPTKEEQAIGIVAQQELCQTCIGEAMAAWAVEHTGGRAHAVAYGVNNDLGSKVQQAAEKRVLEETCEDTCSFTPVTFPGYDEFFNNVGTQSATDIQDGKTNVLMPDYDTFSQPIMSSLAQQNAEERVSVVSSNGTPEVLQNLLGSSPLRADVAFPYTWQGWSHIDLALRILSGEGPIEKAGVPVRLLDETNVGDIDLAGSDEAIFGVDPAKKFPTLWKN
ncbi:sugar ABC transporter substrate-binding protein [Janibacter limosus]|uniref:sugar ABC transporter substrate-binding protein n=1 Tax=Janibacter limosus TaxID=53458 RepID=UPI000A00EA7E|nr:substrate-binding domain-containing protein [Janibacter limosus]